MREISGGEEGRPLSCQQGFSLMEVLIVMQLGLIITGLSGQVYLWAARLVTGWERKADTAAVVAYLRALELRRSVPLGALPPALRARAEEALR